MRRRGGPVQQWVDSIPSHGNATSTPRFDKTSSGTGSAPSDLGEGDNRRAEKTPPLLVRDRHRKKVADMTASAPISIPSSPAITTTCPASSVPHHRLARDPSFQSDSSHCSSVESLLEWRKADPEAILLGLGFGYPSSPQENGSMARIPRRFLQPSKLKGIAVDDFLKQQQESSESLDSASLGYRGLTGSPYVAPSEIVQKIMERLREHESNEIDSFTHTNSSSDLFGSMQQDGRLSVLSPDNRQYLERPRSKSPDMRNKRMIIGEKSFAFGYNGDLIEIKSLNPEEEGFVNPNDYQLSSDDPRIKLAEPSISPEEKIDDEQPTKQLGRRLAKQLSFDDSNYSSRDTLYTIDREEHPALLDRRINEEQRDSLVTVVSRWSESTEPCGSVSGNSYDDTKSTALTRRASDGLCDLKLRRNILAVNEERRMSDSGIHTKVQRLGAAERKNTAARKPGLKRQARVSDADEKYYEDVATGNSQVSSTGFDKFEDYVCRDKMLGKEDIKPDIKTRDLNAMEEKASNFDQESEPEDGKFCSDEKEGCCKNDELDQICEHEETSTDCCCHARSSNCWRKMSKILKKNSQEMALLREKLNSVMSVRMEPGF